MTRLKEITQNEAERKKTSEERTEDKRKRQSLK